MPTFTPPTTDGVPMADPAKVKSDPAHALWNYYGSWAQGFAVWLDKNDVWHQSTAPYLGGATQTVHNGNTTTVTGPDEGLATAKRVYLGGHVYTITQAEADDLTAAGYGANIT